MKRILLSLAVIVGVASLAASATNAYFTSNPTVLGNSVTAGTLTFNLAPNSETPGNSSPVTISGMKPGDGLANENAFYHRWNLKNEGNLNLKYRVRIVVDPAQKNAFYNALKVKAGEYSSGPNKDLGSNLTLDQLEAGILVDSDVMPTASDTRVRTVFLRFYLPTTVGNEVQGLSTSFNVVFDATQTNNPGWT